MAPARDSDNENNNAEETADLRYAAGPYRKQAPVFEIGQKIAERYEITGFLGEGGMGQVYKARDLVLDSFVALKTIRPDIAADTLAFERFKREVKLAHEVADENVCRVYDLDHKNHPPFVAMEFIDGETLSARLASAKGRGLEAGEVAELTEQLAKGLDALHQRGIIHGDFKPGNVMLTSKGGRLRAKIMDFGLAREQALDSTVSASGIMGTPVYMAPEQLAGARATITSDIYALGLVMYEMTTGARPEFDRMREAAPSPRWRAPDLDTAWETAILKCLAREPGQRFSSAGAVAARVVLGSKTAPSKDKLPAEKKAWSRRSIASWGAGLVLLAAGFASHPYIARWFSRLPRVKHIAVLPFRNIGGPATQQAFCDGIAETLAGNLSQLERYQKSFWVVPTTDVRAAGRAQELHQNLGVNLLLTGSVQELGDGIRLIVNLVNADDQRQLDSRTIDAKTAQLSTLQDQVWADAAAMLDLQLTANARTTIQPGGTGDATASQLYLEGIGLLRNPGRQNLDRAIQLLQAAMQRDVNYAVLAGLGEAYAKKYELTKDPQWIPLARSNGSRAAELNPNSANAHLTLGQIYVNTGETEQAIAELKTALEIDPGESQAYYWLGRAYEQRGNDKEAETSFRKLVELRPDFWMSYQGFGWFYYRRGRLEDAAAQFKIVTALLPENAAGYENLGAVYTLMGRYQDAVTTLERAISLNGSAAAYTNLGTAYVMLHRYAGAVPVMEKAVALSPSNDVYWRNLGDAYKLAATPGGKARNAYQHAAVLAEAALRLQPKDTATLSSAALYWAKLGNGALARQRIARALQLAPADNDVLFSAALVYELTGDRQAALKTMQAAYKEGYPLEDIKNAPELDALRKDEKYLKWLKQLVR
jgi:serine/threonine-protein kinase